MPNKLDNKKIVNRKVLIETFNRNSYKITVKTFKKDIKTQKERNKSKKREKSPRKITEPKHTEKINY